MFGLKKYLPLDLVQLTILLSLLRLDPETYLELEASRNGMMIDQAVVLGSSAAFIRTHLHNINRGYDDGFYPSFKSVDNMWLSQSRIFHQLNMLGRYNRYQPPESNTEFTTYLLDSEVTDNHIPRATTEGAESVESAEEAASAPEQPLAEEEKAQETGIEAYQEISKEDMDLIEILLRQDVDIGVTRDVWEKQQQSQATLPNKSSDAINEHTLKVKIKETSGSGEAKAGTPPLLGCDPWAGLNYTIDSETGEHVLEDDCEIEDQKKVEEEKDKPTGSSFDFEGLPDDLGAIFDDINLCLDDETTQFVSLETEPKSSAEGEQGEEAGGSSNLLEQLKELEEMIQTSQLLPHPGIGGRSSLQQSRGVSYLRSMSMEQRWQDLSNVLAIPPNVSGSEMDMHHHHHHHLHHHHHNMSMGLHMVGSGGGGGPSPLPGHHHNNYSIPSYASIDNRTSVLLQNATLPPPIADINANLGYHHNDLGGGDGIGAAVVTSMSTLANGSDLLGVDGHGNGGGYSMDVMMFANGSHSENNQNASSSIVAANVTNVNSSSDGFLSSIINEDDLQLMEMAISAGDPLNSSSSASSFSYFMSNRKLSVDGNNGSGIGGGGGNGVPGEAETNHSDPVNGNMYTMRMLDNDDAMDTSSDSAVSSMGSSERVPSISDGEWMESTSEAGEGEQRNYYGMDCTQAKYRQFSYSYAPGMGPTHRSNGDRGGDRRMPPVAQKKYQLFGKRLTVDQAMGGSPYGTLPHGNAAIPQQPSTPIKYPPDTGDYRYPSALHGDSGSPTYGNLEGATAPSNSTSLHLGGESNSLDSRYNCSIDYDARASSLQSVSSVSSLQSGVSLEHVHHNHTYHMSPEDEGGIHRPSVRDKMKKKMTMEEHLSRDEKRARNLKIPMTTEEIVNLPMDEFNERLSKYDLTETQLTLIRDIRRRGKNKVAAQNCRKRKLDQIVLLAEEVQEIQRDREMTLRDQQNLRSERQMLKEKYSQLYRHVFQSLRDPDGNPYSPHDYSLQQAADGNVIMVPMNSSNSASNNNTNMLGSSSLHHMASHSLAQDVNCDSNNKGAKSKRKDDAYRKSEL